MKQPIFLYDFRFGTLMMGGGDHWGPCGNVEGHPSHQDGTRIWISTPVELDENNLTVKTFSGREYTIESFDGDKEKILLELRELITKYKNK